MPSQSNNYKTININPTGYKESLLAHVGFVLLLGFSVYLRIQYVVAYAGSWDAVDFALALERYDIMAMQPHFPGYPVFIVASSLVNALWVEHPVIALSMVSALSSSMSILLFYLWIHRWISYGWLKLGLTALFAFHPLLTVQGVLPMSESMGLAGVLLMLLLVQWGWGEKGFRLSILIVASFSMGLLLGVRISYFPFVLMLLAPIVWMLIRPETNFKFVLKSFAILLGVGCTGIIFWLIPTVITEGGLLPFLKLGEAFTEGHFNKWGGTLFTSDTSLLQRVIDWFYVQGFLNGLLGGVHLMWAKGVLGALVLASITGWACTAMGIGNRNKSVDRLSKVLFWMSERSLYLFFAIVPYAIWLYVGQNVDKPRHIIPLVPFIILLLGVGLEKVITETGSIKAFKQKVIVTILTVLLLGSAIAFTSRTVEALKAAELPPPHYGNGDVG